MFPALAAVMCALAQSGQSESSPSPDRIRWVKEHAIPLKTVEAGHGFDDLQPLKKFIGDARIVALGEGTHGTREYFQMKHRLVEFLASEMGFTIFSIEASTPEAYAVDEYASHGRGDVQKLIEGMYFWTWRTEEVADMVRWMWTFNQKQAQAGDPRHIRFTGFDMQTPDVAMKIALDFLKGADPAYVKEASEAYAALAKRDSANNSFGVATATFPAQAAAGHRIVFSGWVKTKDVKKGYAGLWWRVDGPKGEQLGFDNMEGRGVQGTSDWTRCLITLDVPKEATNINFGAIFPGKGKAWFDDLAVTIDNEPWPGGGIDLGFEGDAFKGFLVPRQPGYTSTLDAGEAHSGKQSLLLSSGEEPNPKALARLAREVLKHMEGQRDTYLKSADAEKVDWATQNARIVEQWSRLKTGNMLVRDESMAQNVAWILDHSPPNTRVVLWAHNGHVERRGGAMGSHLAKKFGKDYVVLGFATSQGEYTASSDQGLKSNELAAPPVDSLEWVFQAAGLPQMIVPVREASPDDESSSWLTDPVLMRQIGALAMKDQFYPDRVAAGYDGVIYIKNTTAARQLPRP